MNEQRLARALQVLAPYRKRIPGNKLLEALRIVWLSLREEEMA